MSDANWRGGNVQVGAGAPAGGLARLEQRVLRVERHLGLPPLEPAVETAPEPVAAEPHMLDGLQRYAELRRYRDAARAKLNAPREVPAPDPLRSLDEVSPEPVAAPKTKTVEAQTPAGTSPAVSPASPRPNVAPVGVLTYEQKPAAAKISHQAFEQVLGLKVAGWVGAIVLVIGAGLGIKYAYDQGWLGALPPAMRLSLMYVVGFGLIAAGEVVYRRINKISATGLFGAGVATLFLVSYAGHAYYGLYQQQTAFTLMAVSTLVGAGVAMRGRLVSIAALSLIGGLLAPMVIQGDSPLVIPFLSYLLMLQVVALVLSWWGGSGRWWTLRALSLAGTSVWAATKILPHPTPWGPAMWFAVIYAALYQVEVIVSSLRSSAEAREEVESGAGVAFSIIVTAMLTGALLWMFRASTPAVRGIVVVALSAASLAAGVGLVLRESARHVRALAYGYRVQAAVLLLIAVPVAFSGSAISVGWAGVAIALAVIGAKLNDRAARYSSIAAWMLAVANLASWTTDAATRELALRAWLTILGQPIVAWSVIGCGLVFVGHAVALLLGRSSEEGEQNGGRMLSAVASALFALVAIASLPPLGATGALLLYAWLLVGADLVTPRVGMLVQAMAVLALACGKWAIIDILADRFAPGWSPQQYVPVFNPLMLTGVLLAGSIAGMYRLRRGRVQTLLDHLSADSNTTGMTPAVVILTLISLLMTFGLSLEADRVVERLIDTPWPRAQLLQFAWTMLWTAALVGHLFLRTRLDAAASQRAGWRRFAWTAIVLLAVKFCVIDSMLFWPVTPSAGITPLLNLQCVAALVVTGGFALVHLLLRRGENETTGLRVAFAATVVILFAGTVEIDRLAVGGYFPGTLVWRTGQLRQFAWTAWWMVGLAGFFFAASLRDNTRIRRVAWLRALCAFPVMLAIKYLVLDTLAYRVFDGASAATVFVNLQTFAGVIVFGGLLSTRYLLMESGAASQAATKLRIAIGAMMILLLLCLGSLEIDRAFHFSSAVTALVKDQALAEQVALSIYWSLFALAAVAVGFAIRTTGLRYFGLALFACTLFKVGVVDLRQAELGYRILSIIGLGGLLLGTSVLYGRLSNTVLATKPSEPQIDALSADRTT